MRIAIVKTQVPFVRGGAEVLAEGLRDELNRRGHVTEMITIPFQWTTSQQILDSIMTWRLVDITHSNGVATDLVIALNFPAYLIEHPNKVIWMLHQHRTAYDLWETALCDLVHFPDGVQIRDMIRAVDREFLPRAKAIYTISKRVSSRLEQYLKIPSTAIYHPPEHAERFFGGPAEDYLLFPSRISRTKRQRLAIEALARTRQPVRICFAGAPDRPSEQEELTALAKELNVAGRIEWLGWLDDEEKLRRYAHCLGVVFPPIDEDYGYITLEAMLAGKPVVTCTDSGGTLEFVQHEATGLVCAPEPVALATGFDRLWADRKWAAALGAAGRARYESLGISWDAVVEALCGGK